MNPSFPAASLVRIADSGHFGACLVVVEKVESWFASRTIRSMFSAVKPAACNADSSGATFPYKICGYRFGKVDWEENGVWLM